MSEGFLFAPRYLRFGPFGDNEKEPADEQRALSTFKFLDPFYQPTAEPDFLGSDAPVNTPVSGFRSIN